MKTRIVTGQFEALTFPGGERHVKVSSENTYATIDARVRSFNDMGEVLLLTDALKRMDVAVSLNLPYFPGARQDRFLPGEALTVKVYADLVNTQNYQEVVILDPHSPVTPALLNRVRILSPLPAICQFATKHAITHIISPDAGAEKRAYEAAVATGLPVIHGRKKRDMGTGKLSGFTLEPIRGQGNYLIVDDICDGGGTFIGLAEEFARVQGPGWWGNRSSKLFLWVTHGIFSKGVEKLHTYFDGIGTTDSFYEGGETERVSVYPVETL